MNPAVTHPDTARANCRFYFAKLCEEFPKPPDGTDPDTWAARKNKAMDAALALHPENDAECLFAVRVVSADAHAGDALRCAGLADDPDVVRKCRAQAASMMRQSDSALRSLLRLQTIREKQEAAMHPSAMERAGYWYREVAPAEPATPPSPPPPPAQDAAEPVLTQAQIDKEVWLYAQMYPGRAKQIRAAGGLPPGCTFGPPDPYIIEGLLRGAGPTEDDDVSTQDTPSRKYA